MSGRRKVLSYSDAYDAPSGDVDFEQPLPSLSAPEAWEGSAARRGGQNASSAKRRRHKDPSQPQPEVKQQQQQQQHSVVSPSSLERDATWGPPPTGPGSEPMVGSNSQQFQIYMPTSQRPQFPQQPVAYPPQHQYPPHPIPHQHQYSQAQPPLRLSPSASRPPTLSSQQHWQPHPPPIHYNGIAPQFPSGPPMYFGPPPPPFGGPHPHVNPPPSQQMRTPLQTPSLPPPLPPQPVDGGFVAPFPPSWPSPSTPSIPTGPRAEREPWKAAGVSRGEPTLHHEFHSSQFARRSSPLPPPFVWPGSGYHDKMRVVIDDWDVSSDEEDDERGSGSGRGADDSEDGSPPASAMTCNERRVLSKSLRQSHGQLVFQLFGKVNNNVSGAGAASNFAGVGTAGSDSTIAKDNDLLEKKQLEIKAMMERIKKLEAGRAKSKTPVPVSPATAAAAAAAPVNPSAMPSTNGSATPPVTATPVSAPASSSSGFCSASLDAGLLEQRRKLLETLQARKRKAAEDSSADTKGLAGGKTADPTSITTSTCASLSAVESVAANGTSTRGKRKAEDDDSEDDEDEGEKHINGHDDGSKSAAATTVGVNDEHTPSVAGKKTKRQRKKERRRAERAQRLGAEAAVEVAGVEADKSAADRADADAGVDTPATPSAEAVKANDESTAAATPTKKKTKKRKTLPSFSPTAAASSSFQKTRRGSKAGRKRKHRPPTDNDGDDEDDFDHDDDSSSDDDEDDGVGEGSAA